MDQQAASIPEARKDFLLQATKVLFSSLEHDKTLRTLADLVVPEIADWCVIHVLHDDGAIHPAATAYARPEWAQVARDWAARFPAKTSDQVGVGMVIRTGTPVVALDVAPEVLAAHARGTEHAAYTQRLGIRSVIIVPLVLRDRVVGALSLVQSASERRFIPSDVPFAEALALRAAIAIENARLFRAEADARGRSERALQRLTLLHEVTRALTAATTPTEVTAVLATPMRDSVGAANAIVFLVRGDDLEMSSAAGVPGATRASWAAVPLAAPLPLPEVARTGKARYFESADALASAYPSLDRRAFTAAAWAMLPLRDASATLGAVVLGFPAPRAFEADDRALLEALAEQGAQALVRARLHAELAAKEERFELASMAVDEGIWEWDVRQPNAWRSPRSERLFGYEPGELGPDDAAWLSRVHEDDRERTQRELEALLASVATRGSTEYRFRRKDGTYAVVLDRCTVVRDESGKPQRLVGTMLDISRLKELERAALFQKALLESQNEAALDGIFFQDENARVVFYNRRLLEMWGVPPDLPHRATLEERLGESLEALADPRSFYDLAMRMERERDATHREDLLLKDGRVFDCYTAPVRDDAGVYRGRVWFYRDVTQRRHAEQELVAARRQLAHSEKLAAMGALVSGVAHEVRTPLAYVSNHAELLRSWANARATTLSPQDRARVEDSVSAIGEGVERMNRLVQDLRRFVRVERAERGTLVDDAAREAIRLFEATHRGGVRLEIALGANATATVDRVQLQQVILNLLENAAEASPRGATVRLASVMDGDDAVIRVEDEGPGIPADVQARMWEPFYTTKQEGTGLGLSIVRRIAEQAGGSARCESEPGKGARFEVRLPAKR